MDIMMSGIQISAIYGYLNKTDTVLEYGSGGSTTHFSKYVKHYYSIEHNKEWYEKVKNESNDISNLSYSISEIVGSSLT